MKKFICLHTADSEVHYVNTDKIVALYRDKGYEYNAEEPWFPGREPVTHLALSGADYNLMVRETPEEIINLMEGCGDE